MSRPGKQRVSAVARAITHHGGQKINWDKTVAALWDAIERDSTGTVALDGFPTGHGGPTSKGGHADPTGNNALRRADPRDRPMVDEHHRDTIEAFRHMREAATHIEALIARLDKIAAVTGKAPDPDPCESCAREPGYRVDADHFGDVVGRLDRMVRLCNDCYMWTYRKHDAGDKLPMREGLPPVEKIKAAHEGRRFREKVS